MIAPSSIAHYKITTKLGEGGMGAVYRATDTKLGRDVAIKVLPDSFANDHDRLARFTREAQVLASLNHPNIAAIYGVEDHALILELVEGPTLAERLVHGAIPLEEALPIARQIAEGIEFAHERGIIHRDLKPANVKIREDGTVKLLDFGLAKAFSPDDGSGSAELMNSPTLTGRATQLGVILGTAAYMAPEQAKGKAVDRRADIWAFGIVVYEMLTGKRGYQAEDVSETLAAVLTREVDWTALPAATPARLRTLLRDCMARDPRQRLRDVGEARRVLDQLISGAADPSAGVTASIVPPAQISAGRRALPWAITAAAALGAIAFATLYFSHTNESPPEVRLQIVTPSIKDEIALGFSGNNFLTLSPDGRSIVYVANTEDGKSYRLWLRPLDSELAKPLPGTELPIQGTFWSPDSKWIGFFADKKLKRIDVATGTVQTLADAPTPRGGTWSRDGTILFSPAGNGILYRMPAAGGQPEPVTQFRSQEVTHRWPQFLPDGRHFVFWISGTPEVQGIYAGALDSHEYRKICVADGPAIFAPPGHLFFVRESVLYGQQFDPDTMKLSGEPIPVASDVSTSPYTGLRFTASSQGTIAYRPDVVVTRQMTWLDRLGKPLGTVGEPLDYLQVGELSPDGRTLAVTTQRGAGRFSISMMDMTRGTVTPLGRDTGTLRWSPDGSKIAFGCVPRGHADICWKVAGSNGPGEVLYPTAEAKNLDDWSPDGKYILYTSQMPKTARDVMAVPFTGNDRQPIPVAQTPAAERSGRFSPDGKWVAYESDEIGPVDVFVRPFPGPGPAVRVSTGGGSAPFWRKDGKELYYRLGDQLMAVSIKMSSNGGLALGIPVPLFKANGSAVVQTDGQRFLFAMKLHDVSTPPITVIVNWVGLEK
jgi:serine/threonine protein kinase